MKKNNRKLGVAAGFCLGWSACVSADLLNLSQLPLAISGRVDPNIMLMMDTSGSMKHIVPEPPYDPDLQINCPSRNYYRGNVRVKVQMTGDRKGEVRIGGSLWGNGDTGKCFENGKKYTGFLQDIDYVPGGAGTASYFGHYLNWYFSKADPQGSDNRIADIFLDANGKPMVRKPGTRDRLEIAKAVATKLVSDTGITNSNVGLTGFKFKDPSRTGGGDVSKGNILYGLSDIDEGENRHDLKTAISELEVDGNTPLAGTLAQIGRYFVERESLDAELLDLTASDHAIARNGNQTAIKPSKLFATEPEYEDKVPKPRKGVITAFCQKSFVVALTDGLPSADSGYSDILAVWEDNQRKSDAPYDFDDVAEALYDLDLRPDLKNGDVKKGKNNIVTHVVGFLENDEMLQDAATGTYATANNEEELFAALANAINASQADAGSAAAVAVNSQQLNAENGVYQVRYDTGNWSGSLLAYGRDDKGNIEKQPKWDAGTRLSENRNILTFNTTTKQGVTFAWDNLDANQQNDLSYNGSGSEEQKQVFGEAVMDYLQGQRSNEGENGLKLRARSKDTVLGDIVSSAPVYVGAPQSNWPEYERNHFFGGEGKSYSTFKKKYAESPRTPVIYVGANDGMLHGFNAHLDLTKDEEAGREKIAYIPGALYSSQANEGLHYYTEKQYQHRFYVDLTPTVSDVFIKRSAVGSKDWRTILVGGLRAGGRGLFALDITDPSEFDNADKADDIVLWEFSSQDDPDLGYTYSQPTIAMMQNGKWAVIVGNGYNSSEGSVGDGKAKLFILFIEDGIDGKWDAGDYIEIDTGVGSAKKPNGLSKPRVVDLNGDSIADRIYAGDLQGNLWVFDVSQTTGTGDAKKLLATLAPGGDPLFEARSADGKAQPITSSPRVARHPAVRDTDTNQPNLLVLFGTGKYVEPTDVSENRDIMSYYAVWDRARQEQEGKIPALTRTRLAERKAITKGGTLREITGGAIDWGEQYGWYLDLLNRTSEAGEGKAEGERVFTESLLINPVVFFNTNIPADVPCVPGGTGWYMALDIATGLAPDFKFFDWNNDGVIDDEDLGIGGKFESRGLLSDPKAGEGEIDTSVSNGDINRDDADFPGQKEGRLFWEELFRN